MQTDDGKLGKILKYLPVNVCEAINTLVSGEGKSSYGVSEIRLRAQAPVSVTYKGENIYAFSGKSILCGEREIQDTLGKLCEDSVHTYGDTIKEGYVTLDGGYRIGVCGSAHSEGENIRGIYAISSLVIRIPHIVKNAAEGIIDIVKKEQQVVPTLFYAPPGTGKTTLLRDLALKISSGLNAMRVCIVDTRGELYQKELFRNSLVDVLSGYPRGKGMEIATRTMSAQVIICDEIGSRSEAEAILSVQNSGVPLIASAHADSITSLLRRPNIRLLYDAGIFENYIGMKRENGSESYEFEVSDK